VATVEAKQHHIGGDGIMAVGAAGIIDGGVTWMDEAASEIPHYTREVG
jgi:hypothetical protein